MKKLFYFLFLIFTFSFFISSCSSDEDTSNDENTIIIEPLFAETILNVSYGENPQQAYDIYLPADRNTNKTKVLVLVHGGSWVGGDKADMNDFITLIQQFLPDHAIVNINYVLATTTEPIIPAFPNQFLDVGLVIAQLTEQKEELHILPEFGLIGSSAGAHISLMYDYKYDENDVVKMVCDIVGPTNFTDPFYAENPFFDILLAALIDENTYPLGTNYAEATSPALLVSSESSPSILFYGNQDPLVPLSNGELLKNNLGNASITNSFTVYDGGHGDWDEASFIDLQSQLLDFIETHLPIEE